MLIFYTKCTCACNINTSDILEFVCAALVTLKHGEEAESCIALLSKTMLKDKQVEVSLYRNDNLLCITNLPLMMEDTDFRKFVEPFGQIEKGFLMRNNCG